MKVKTRTLENRKGAAPSSYLTNVVPYAILPRVLSSQPNNENSLAHPPFSSTESKGSSNATQVW